MAKDVITRFRLETTQFDSKIKSAAKELSEYTKAASNAGKEFQKFTKDNVAAAQALGKMATSSQDAKGKVKELVGAFNEAAKAYNALTKEQQQSDFGKAMAASLTQLQQRIRETKAEMQSMGNVSKNMGGGFSGVMGNMSKVLGVSPAMLTGIGAAAAAFAGLKEVIGGNISTAMGFEKSMSQLSSLTGMTGKDLDKLKEYAIDLGSTSTLTASQVADAFRLIGSQQPQLLSSGEALKEVTKYAITLSEAAGIDLQTAAQTLSTSINQMGGDSNNAARYVNVLAAASQKGAGDIAWLGEAITKSATAAKAVGTDYEELVANLEQLAKAGFDASTAGTALRSIIMNLEKQANNEFKPSVVGLTQAFENLGKANLDIVGYQEIAGKMFASQAMALANASQEAKKMTEAITGTNIAEAQAKTNTDNLDGALKSLASAWEGLNLHINSSNGLLKAFVDWCTNVIRDLDNMTTSAGRAKKALQELNGGDNGQPSKVDRQINALRGSNFKQQKYNSTLGQYDQDIKVAEYYKKKYKEAGWAGGSVLSDITRRFGVNMRGEEDIDNLINNLKTLREDYKRRAEKLLNPTVEADNGKGKGGVVLDVDADTEKATKSIKELQGEIKKLKKLRDDAANAGNTKLRDQYNTQIKSVQAQIKAMRGTGSTSTNHKTTPEYIPLEGSIDAQTKKVQDLQKAWRAAADDKSREDIKKQIDEAQRTLDLMTGKIKAMPKIDIKFDGLAPNGLTGKARTPEDLQQGAVKMKQAVQLEIDQEASKVDAETLKTLMKDAIQNGINGMDLQFGILGDKIGKGIDIPDDSWQGIIDQYNALREMIGEEPIVINFKTGKIDKVVNETEKLKKTIGTTAQVVGTIGQAFNAIEDPAAKVAGTVAQAIANIALAYSDALAKDETTKFNIWGFIAAAAASTISMATTIAQIHSQTGYAQGGIVKGNTYSGDMIPANGGSIGLDAGEVVLNRAQSGVLASQLEGSAGGFRNGQIVGRIEGEKIVLVANRYFRRTGQGEILTWK